MIEGFLLLLLVLIRGRFALYKATMEGPDELTVRGKIVED